MSKPPRTIERSSLGLAVMAVLFERPSHPYDINRTLRERGKDEVVDFKPAAVYRMVERLVSAGLVEEVGTDREGKRPERTVYRLTEEGAGAVQEWAQEMLARPRNEYPTFAAAVSFLPLLLPDAARAVLEMRATLLDAEIARLRSLVESAGRTTFPRLFMLEDELRLAAMEGESRWVKDVVEDLASGRLTWDHESLAEIGRQSTLQAGIGDAWRDAKMA
jgi:DNA-binding PadR family transcriptional regulator